MKKLYKVPRTKVHDVNTFGDIAQQIVEGSQTGIGVNPGGDPVDPGDALANEYMITLHSVWDD